MNSVHRLRECYCSRDLGKANIVPEQQKFSSIEQGTITHSALSFLQTLFHNVSKKQDTVASKTQKGRIFDIKKEPSVEFLP